MTSYEKELEAMNASFEMRLEEAYDEIGRYKRKVKNAIVIVEESRLAENVRRNLLNELRGALDE